MEVVKETAQEETVCKMPQRDEWGLDKQGREQQSLYNVRRTMPLLPLTIQHGSLRTTTKPFMAALL